MNIFWILLLASGSLLAQGNDRSLVAELQFGERLAKFELHSLQDGTCDLKGEWSAGEGQKVIPEEPCEKLFSEFAKLSNPMSSCPRAWMEIEVVDKKKTTKKKSCYGTGGKVAAAYGDFSKLLFAPFD